MEFQSQNCFSEFGTPSRKERSISMKKSDNSQMVDNEKKVETGDTIIGPVNVNFSGTGIDFLALGDFLISK